MYEPGGHYAPVEQILYPPHHGLLAFTGFTILEPFVVHGPNRMNSIERKEHLAAYRTRLMSLDHAHLSVTGWSA